LAFQIGPALPIEKNNNDRLGRRSGQKMAWGDTSTGGCGEVRQVTSSTKTTVREQALKGERISL
jgi:hypothetical protein